MKFTVTSGAGVTEVVDRPASARTALERVLALLGRKRNDVCIFDEDGRRRTVSDLCRLAAKEVAMLPDELGLSLSKAKPGHISSRPIGGILSRPSPKLIEATKTASGQRIIPISETLRRMLTEWQPDCPSLERVFPAPQGGVLLYSGFLHRFWRPALQRMGLPPVSIHSARASFISMLQASGVDVATAAKLAGHKTPNVTLQYLRDGHEALNALEAACLGP